LLTGLDPSRPVNSLPNQTLNSNTNNPSFVSDGLNRSPNRHRFDTNSTQENFGDKASEDAQRAEEPKLSIDYLKKSSEITKNFGTHHCTVFRKKIFEQFPFLSFPLAHEFLKTANKKGNAAGNLKLLHYQKLLMLADLPITTSDSGLKDFAIEQSLQCIKIRELLPKDLAVYKCLELIDKYSLPIQRPKTDEFGFFINRVCETRWWLRNIRRVCDQKLAEVERELGLVNDKKSPYASKRSINSRKRRLSLQREFMKEQFLTNHLGEKFSLAEVADKNVSNPAIRRAELMTRIHGFEIVAQLLGHSCVFLTLTTPSRMHKSLKKGRHNKKFDGTTPSEAQQYLNQAWACMRAEFSREGLQPYGFRIAEPHHDGTPHWHFLLFSPQKDLEKINKSMRKHGLKVDGSERGAAAHRFKVIDIDLENGSAAGYVAKYISKNIDGEFLDEDLLGNPAKQAAEAIETWARNHNIRQFQQIGGPSVTVWRELRKLKEPLDNKDAEKARFAADSGDWAAYVLAMGGIHKKASERPIKPLYEHVKATDIETGEVLDFSLSSYGDVRQKPIRGLRIEGNVIYTRQFVWHENRLLEPLRAEKLRTDWAPAQPVLNFSEMSGTWTCVNNCTDNLKSMN
jgi:hypothetical protein